MIANATKQSARRAGGEITAAEVVKRYLAWSEKNRSPLNTRRSRSRLTKWLRTIPRNLPAQSVLRSHIDDWLNASFAGVGPATRGTISWYTAPFNWAKDAGLIESHQVGKFRHNNYRKKIQRHIAAPQRGEPRSDGKLTARGLVLAFLSYCHEHSCAKTITLYRCYLASFLDAIPKDLPADSVSRYRLEKWLNADFANAKPSTRADASHAVTRAFNWARESGLIEVSHVGKRSGIPRHTKDWKTHYAKSLRKKPRPGAEITARDLMLSFLAWSEHNLPASFLLRRLYLLTWIETTPADLPASSIRESHIDNWLDANWKPEKLCAKRNAQSTIRSAFCWAKKSGLIEFDHVNNERERRAEEKLQERAKERERIAREKRQERANERELIRGEKRQAREKERERIRLKKLQVRERRAEEKCQAAERRRLDWRACFAGSFPSAPRADGKTTVRDLAWKFLEWSEKGYPRYRFNARRRYLMMWLATLPQGFPANAVRKPHLDDWINSTWATEKRGSRRNAAAAVRAIFNWAAESDLIEVCHIGDKERERRLEERKCRGEEETQSLIENLCRSAPLDHGAITVRLVVGSYLKYSQKRDSAATFSMRLRYLSAWLASIPESMVASEIRPFHVEDWLEASWTRAQSSARRAGGASVTRAFNWAKRRGLIDAHRLTGFRLAQDRRRGAEAFLNQEQCDALEAAAKESESLWLHDYVVVMLETGCRPQEIRKVEARQFDRAERCWIFSAEEAPKGDKKRVVYLGDRACDICERLANGSEAGPMFRNNHGAPLKPLSIASAFRAISKRVGFRVQAYFLRHTWATRAIENGVSPMYVAELMGHSNLKMLTEVYQHVGADKGRMQAARAKAVGGLMTVAQRPPAIQTVDNGSDGTACAHAALCDDAGLGDAVESRGGLSDEIRKAISVLVQAAGGRGTPAESARGVSDSPRTIDSFFSSRRRKRVPKPFWKESHKCFYIKNRGKFYRLAPDRAEAFEMYAELLDWLNTDEPLSPAQSTTANLRRRRPR